MTILRRVIVGVALLLLLLLGIVAVSYWSTRSIDHRLGVITGQSAPLAQAASDLNVRLLGANQILLGLVAEQDASRIETARRLFDTQMDQYRQLHDSLPGLLVGHPSLQQTLTKEQQAGQTYAEQAHELITRRLELLDLERQVRALQAYATPEGNRLTGYLQTYIARQQAAANSATVRAAQVLQIETAKPYTAFASQALVPDLWALQRALNQQDEVIAERLRAFAALDPVAARYTGVMVTQLRHDLTAPDGLYSGYQRQSELTAHFNLQRQSTAQALQATLDGLRVFSEQTLSLARQATRDTNATVAYSRAVLLGVAAVAILAALLIGVWVARGLRRPLKLFREALRRATAGDLRVRFDTTRRDEFGELGSYLNELLTVMQETVDKLTRSADDLTLTARDNAGISARTTAAVDEQSHQLGSATSALTQMESTVAEVAQRAQDTKDAVDHSFSLTCTVQHSVTETIDSIRRQAGQIQLAASVTDELQGYGQSIDGIVDAIRTIAEQTNLLALNAAIEAARAGEQGRGFAVVADEVRSLASRTQASTTEIQRQIEQMQHKIQSVVEAMGSGRQQSDECVRLASTAQDALQVMTQAVERIRDMNVQIATATEEQSVTVQQTSRMMTHINDAALQAAEGAQSTARSSDGLSRMAQAQRQLLQHFTV